MSFDEIQGCKTYAEYVLKCEVYGEKPNSEEEFKKNKEGIFFMPYIPIQRLKDDEPLDEAEVAKYLARFNGSTSI